MRFYTTSRRGCQSDIVEVDVSIKDPVSITQQPTNQEICNGQPFTLSVKATGTNLKYQWYRGNEPINNATTDTHTATAAAATAGSYYVVVTGDCGPLTSDAVTVTVNEAPSEVIISPASPVLCEGGSATLSVQASGTAPLNYQWQHGDNDIHTAIADTYIIDNAALNAAGSYSVRVVNTCGTATSTATVTVNKNTVINTPPTDQTLCAGNDFTLTVEADGTNLSYQCYHGGSPITGATLTAYTRESATTGDTGSYHVAVTGACGPVQTSAPWR